MVINFWDNKYLRNSFFILALCLGICHIIILPPFQSPDEPNHYVRIYQISEGQLWGEVSADKKELGGYAPKNISQVFSPFMDLPFHKERKLSNTLITNNLFKKYDFSQDSFIAIPNTARYAFTAYLPQATTLFFLKKIDTPPLLSIYILRLINYLFWLGIIFYAVKITPVYKHWLMVLAILPTSIAINSSISADVISNAFVFLFFALFLKYKFGNAKIIIPDLIFSGSLIVLITWQKIVYFPLLFLFLLIPTTQFEKPKHKYLSLISMLIINLSLIYWWSGAVNKMIYPTGDKYLTTYKTMRPDAIVNPKLQTEYILNDIPSFITSFFKASFNTYGESLNYYLASSSWDGIGIPSGLMYMLKGVLILFFLSQARLFSIWERFYLISLGHGMVMLFLLSQHLHWDAVGDAFITDYGGKYYIPIYPVILLAFGGVLHSFFQRKSVLNSAVIFLLVMMLVVHIDFLVIIFERYYK
jgi:uncharacterized membrane protein